MPKIICRLSGAMLLTPKVLLPKCNCVDDEHGKILWWKSLHLDPCDLDLMYYLNFLYALPWLHSMTKCLATMAAVDDAWQQVQVWVKQLVQATGGHDLLAMPQSLPIDEDEDDDDASNDDNGGNHNDNGDGYHAATTNVWMSCSKTFLLILLLDGTWGHLWKMCWKIVPRWHCSVWKQCCIANHHLYHRNWLQQSPICAAKKK